MGQNLLKFKQSLKQKHYSQAFIQHLVSIIIDNQKIATIQEINQVIKKQSDLIINYFNSEEADLLLIESRNPLCFQSIRDYFNTMTRTVYKRYGNEINKFKEGLTVISKELIQTLNASTHRIAKNSQLILKDNTAKKILIYSYSKSIILSLKKLSKALQDNLQVFVCKSGYLQEGIKVFQQLVMEGVKCHLINDNEVGFYIHKMTCVLVGAEIILENGAIINRAGTSIIALLAHSAKKPLYVFAQSYKFLRKTYLTQRDIPQKFIQDKQNKTKAISIDLTLPEYITMFCTDNGLYDPEVISLEFSKILK